ncbi:hypothetical protein TrRE_jg12047 [Triparma retinervis]|uniref:Uncharacterized protein n=1 Tax=Triparma retinervis TaxID=2557542 RepID=A0A9W7AET5_9STRA|nr:hypothetical protein TrRE_jg12047 [Triparma retinervis]
MEPSKELSSMGYIQASSQAIMIEPVAPSSPLRASSTPTTSSSSSSSTGAPVFTPIPVTSTGVLEKSIEHVSRAVLGGVKGNGFNNAVSCLQRIKKQRILSITRYQRQEAGGGVTSGAPVIVDEFALAPAIMNPHTIRRMKEEYRAGIEFCDKLKTQLADVMNYMHKKGMIEEIVDVNDELLATLTHEEDLAYLKQVDEKGGRILTKKEAGQRAFEISRWRPLREGDLCCCKTDPYDDHWMLGRVAIAWEPPPNISYKSIVDMDFYPNRIYLFTLLALYFIVTILAVVDRFTTNLSPRQSFARDYEFCRKNGDPNKSFCGNDFYCDGDFFCLKPGPTSVKVFDALSRISGRIIITSTSILFLTMCHSLFNIIATSPYPTFLQPYMSMRLPPILYNYKNDNTYVHSIAGTVTAVCTVIHVWSLFLPSMFDGDFKNVLVHPGDVGESVSLPLQVSLGTSQISTENNEARWGYDDIWRLSDSVLEIIGRVKKLEREEDGVTVKELRRGVEGIDDLAVLLLFKMLCKLKLVHVHVSCV